jgi:signal transduction histidine kinase
MVGSLTTGTVSATTLHGSPENVAGRLTPDLSRRIGHELRGCLTGIAGLAGIMARRAEQTGADDELRRLQMIEDSARAGITTVDQVVELLQIETGQIRCHIRTADAEAIIAAAIGACAALAGAAQHVIAGTSAGDVPVRTDPDLVQSIVTELIANALVAGAASEVQVHAMVTDTAAIMVTDNGRGIPPEDQVAVFDPFVRGETAADGAAGLGLHLARRRAQILGATLTVLSSPGNGSTFTLTLPDGSAARRAAAPPHRPSGPER